MFWTRKAQVRYMTVILIIYHTLIYMSHMLDFQIALIILIGGEKPQAKVGF